MPGLDSMATGGREGPETARSMQLGRFEGVGWDGLESMAAAGRGRRLRDLCSSDDDDSKIGEGVQRPLGLKWTWCRQPGEHLPTHQPSRPLQLQLQEES